MYKMYVDETTKPGKQGVISIGFVLFLRMECLAEVQIQLPPTSLKGSGEYEALLRGLTSLKEQGIKDAVIYTDSNDVYSEVFKIGKQNKREDLRRITKKIQDLLEMEPGFKVGLISTNDNLAHYVCRGEDWREHYRKDEFVLYEIDPKAIEQYKQIQYNHPTNEDITYQLSRGILVSKSYKNYYMFDKLLIFVDGNRVTEVKKQTGKPVKINQRRAACLDVFVENVNTIQKNPK